MQRAESHPRFTTGGNRRARPFLVPTDPRIRRVLQAVGEGESHSIEELARMVNLSSSRLSHLFKTQTGLSLQNVINRRRLEIAVELLRNTSMPVKEVSYRAGYRHASSFVRAFRNEFGASPSSYRDPLADDANEQRI
jgi:AraC family transcriptional regulator of arabinose operon